MESKRDDPSGIIGKYVVSREKGRIVFRVGEPANEMFFVLTGSVSLRKEGKEIGLIPLGKCFGGISFLLLSLRVTTAMALDDVNLVAINHDNINELMNEHPEIEMEMVQHLREASKMID